MLEGKSVLSKSKYNQLKHKRNLGDGSYKQKFHKTKKTLVNNFLTNPKELKNAMSVLARQEVKNSAQISTLEATATELPLKRPEPNKKA